MNIFPRLKNLIVIEHDAFLVTILLKGLNGFLEIIGGLLIILFPPSLVLRLADFLTQNEVSEDPRDKIANYFLHSLQGYSSSTQDFWSIYFFIHGAIKIFLVVALLQRRLWAYPVAIAVFSVFVFYQLYRFTLTGSIFLIILSVIDILVIIFTSLEYKRLKKQRVQAKVCLDSA
jgi:uncharacterized membrane protein